MWGPVNAGGWGLPAPLVPVVPLRPLLGPLVVAGKMVPPPTNHKHSLSTPLQRTNHNLLLWTSGTFRINILARRIYNSSKTGKLESCCEFKAQPVRQSGAL